MQNDEASTLGARSLGPSELNKPAEAAESLRLSDRSKSGDTLKYHHPLEDRKKLRSCVRLLDTSNFDGLPKPLPRAQDLPQEFFGTPSIGDQVVSVSHAWRNQAHPDPTCDKTRLLSALLSKLNGPESPGGHVTRESRVFLFFDFLSIPQKPFHPNQDPRSSVETKEFHTALECMHEVFYFSDRIIHLPWQNSEVPGEGVESTIPLVELCDAGFTQLGDCVQIAELRQPQSTQFWKGITTSPLGPQLPKPSAPRAHLFDQVVSVDGEAVRSVAQLEKLLACSAMSATVQLRSYPFGMSNNIPADARGWVFLERFITMVKCAMVDEETAKNVIITPSEDLFQEIMKGASRLRAAAMQDLRRSRRSSRGEGELKRVLASFIAELDSKEFAPASTDKWELHHNAASSCCGEDRNLVDSIMRDFVAHLATHWEVEAVKQRSFARRLNAVVAATESFLLEWDCFSEDYAARLAKASTVNPWPVVLLVVLPLAALLAHVLFPYNAPDEGWRSQTAHWAWGCPLEMLVCISSFPVFLTETTGILCTGRVHLRLLLWIMGTAIWCELCVFSIAYYLDIFPVPMTNLLACSVTAPTLPVLWWCIPAHNRASSHFRKRLFYSIIALLSNLTLMGIGVPMLNAALPAGGEAWQLLIISGYLVLKLTFEGLGVALSRHLGADGICFFVFFATYFYQVNLCVAFSKVSSWVVVAAQISFDVLENMYHLWSIWSPRDNPRRAQYIVASLVLREFVELAAPLQFLSMHALARDFRPRNFGFLCNRGEQEVQRVQKILLVDIAVELFGSCITYTLLAYKGHSPMRMLRGVIATRLVPFVIFAATSLLYYSTMQHSHWGMDLSFQWNWVFDRETFWACGLTWVRPSQS